MDLLLHIPACWERIRAYSSRFRACSEFGRARAQGLGVELFGS